MSHAPLPEHIPQTLRDCFAAQRAAFQQARNPSLQERRQDLRALHRLLLENREALVAAVNQDFGCRSRFETLMTELLQGQEAALDAIRHVPHWMKKQRRALDVTQYPLASAYVVPQPLGVVGIVVPWNFPIAMTVQPMIGALAAGNRVMVKMSENSAHLARLLQSLLPRYFAADKVSLFQDAGDDGQSIGPLFTQLPFNHLFFTGSPQTGKAVMANCAANLTPVTLELGGKSPAVVLPGADVAEAATRIVHGKAANCGQICVAPDYALVPRASVEAFAQQAQAAFARLYGPRVQGHPDYTALVNERHRQRIAALLDDARAQGATVIACAEGGTGRQMPLHIVTGLTPRMRIAQEEIFGPILPVLAYDTLDDAIAIIQGGPRPLALYAFGHDAAARRRLLAHTHSGGVTVNDWGWHVLNHDAPFGGVGNSGMGTYHGEEGFRELSHARTVFLRHRFFPIGLFYPPFGNAVQRLVLRLWLGAGDPALQTPRKNTP